MSDHYQSQNAPFTKVPGHQTKTKQQANVIGNRNEVSSFDSQAQQMQVDSGPANQLNFLVPGQETKNLTVEEFKKLCGSSQRLYDVLKYKGRQLSHSFKTDL